MLVLHRMRGESIQIGDDVLVTVVEVAPGVVRLGVDAPPEVPVLRSELLRPERHRAADAGLTRRPRGGGR